MFPFYDENRVNEEVDALKKFYEEKKAEKRENLLEIAKDVNEWLKRIGLGGTAHQRSLEDAINKCEDIA